MGEFEPADKQPLTREIAQAAIDGDRDAIERVLEHYAKTIDALCVRTSRKRDGTVVSHIDEDMRNQIKHMFIKDLPKATVEELLG